MKKVKITNAKGSDRIVALCFFTSNILPPPKKSAATVMAAADYINML
jgi:hypothetical protein